MWTELVWLRIGTGGEVLCIRYSIFGFHKMLGKYRVAQTTTNVSSSAQLHRVSYVVIRLYFKRVLSQIMTCRICGEESGTWKVLKIISQHIYFLL
jgi:hypothetical protein